MFELKLSFLHSLGHRKIELKLALRMMILFEWRKPGNSISNCACHKQSLHRNHKHHIYLHLPRPQQ